MNPTIVGIFVMMCATAYAFILDVEAKQRQQQQQQQQEQQQQQQQQQQQDNDELASLKKVVKEEKNKLDKMQEVVHQLLGGLFNQVTQSNILKQHCNRLSDNEEFDPCQFEEFDPCQFEDDIMPTTRQGDKNTKDIAQLSALVSTLQNKEKENVKIIQKQQEQIDRMECSLKRIIEGLYDWETQAPVHTHEIELLMGFPLTRKNEFAEMEMEDVCDMNPTTQQGFRLEKRMDTLEAKMALLD